MMSSARTTHMLVASRRLFAMSRSTVTCTSSSMSTISAAQREQFHRDGFVPVPDVLSAGVCAELTAFGGVYEDLFAGRFETGTYPDEWHWREGLSFPHVTREIVNGWKCSRAVAAVVLSERIGKLVTDLMGWPGCRIGQDDVLWKPPGGSTVGWHQDSAYISKQFVPEANNSVTVWIALDDADEATGVVEYCPGSHMWEDRETALHSAVDSSFHGDSSDYRAALYETAAAYNQEPTIVRMAVPAGSAIFHHQNVWHGSDKNSTEDRPRRALGIHYIRSDVRFREEPAPDYIYGRYQLLGSNHLDDSFFPIVYSTTTESDGVDSRSDWIDAYIRGK